MRENTGAVWRVDLTASLNGPDLDVPYLEAIRGVDYDSVFIMGLNRSGTSILHNLLAKTGCFSYFSVFHIVNRKRILYLNANPSLQCEARELMSRWFEEQRLTDRKYDAVPVGPDAPEEYGYALPFMGARPRLTNRNIGAFREVSHKIHVTGAADRPMLLKNPWDTNNFLHVRKLLPRSRYIFIHRNPVPVLSSQLKMFGGLIQQSSEYDMLIEDKYRQLCENRLYRTIGRVLFSDRLPLLLWRIYRNAMEGCDYMLRHCDTLGEAAIHITYSDLCDHPESCLERILGFVGVCSSTPAGLAGMVAPRRTPIHPKVEQIRRNIEERTRDYCAKFRV